MNEKFQNALHQKAQSCPPVWFMRQAGRYHQHYQALKEKYTFVQLCKEPELAAEVAMGPVEEFDFDAAILFSDLLFPLEVLGMGLEYNPGPQLSYQLDEDRLKKFKPIEEALEGMLFQKQAMKLTRERLPKDKSLIGFVGGPWTLFTYAIEGAHKGHLLNAKSNWRLFEHFNEIILPFLEGNIKLQIEGGAEIIMLFDTAAGELSPQLFRQYLEPGLKRLAKAFPKQLGYYSKGTQSSHLGELLFGESEFLGFGVDHSWSLPSVLTHSERRGFVQGNFDQALLFADTSDFKGMLKNYLDSFVELTPEQRRGWVCGLGHGVLPKTPESHVKFFVEEVRRRFS